MVEKKDVDAEMRGRIHRTDAPSWCSAGSSFRLSTVIFGSGSTFEMVRFLRVKIERLRVLTDAEMRGNEMPQIRHRDAQLTFAEMRGNDIYHSKTAQTSHIVLSWR